MPYEYSQKEFVKLYRKFINWEWYTDSNTKALFIHCLLRANWKEGSWKGIHYNAGEFITSLNSLSKETGMTVQQVRTALKHLQKTGEITSISTDRATGKKLTKNRIITVKKWDLYQGSNKQSNKQLTSESTSKATSKQQASNNSRRTYKEDIEEVKEKKEGDFPGFYPDGESGSPFVEDDPDEDPNSDGYWRNI